MGQHYNDFGGRSPKKSKFPQFVGALALVILGIAIHAMLDSRSTIEAPPQMSVQEALQMVEGGSIYVPSEPNNGDDDLTNVPDSDPVPTPEPEPAPEPSTEPEPEPVQDNYGFSSVTYSGSGDDVVEISPPKDRAWVLEISGNAAGRHFAVSGYDANMEDTELFVNTTDPYKGVVVDPSLSTILLEVTAKDAWEITIHDLFATVPSIGKGELITGRGDAVYQITSYGMVAGISGNTDSRHFAVETFGDESDELLVNTTDPYNGNVMLKGKPFLLIINSDSDWTIQF